MEEQSRKPRKVREEEDEQEIWSWGAGTDGQLGTGRLEDDHLPQLLHLPSLSSLGPISLLACGGAHVIALTAGTTSLHSSVLFFQDNLTQTHRHRHRHTHIYV